MYDNLFLPNTAYVHKIHGDRFSFITQGEVYKTGEVEFNNYSTGIFGSVHTASEAADKYKLKYPL